MADKILLLHSLVTWLALQMVVMCGGARQVVLKGEKCGNGTNNASCDLSMALECSQGVCDCKSGYTISRNGTKCLEVARYGLESPCDESIQCWKSLLGRLSECNIGTNKCSCYESDTLPIVYHQGRCYYGESLGEYCQIDGLCSATTVHAVCKMGICQCKDGYVPSWDKSRCLPIASPGLNSPCEENIQCEKSPLGTLSECNLERMQCECYQIPMVPMVFHHGRCYFGAGLGDVCQVVPQCSSKISHSVCGKDGKCRCSHGYLPNANLTACLPLPPPPPQPDSSSDPSSSTASDGTQTGNEARDKPECSHNGHCAKFGHFSRCNQTRRKCECFNPDTNTTIKGVSKERDKDRAKERADGSSYHSNNEELQNQNQHQPGSTSIGNDQQNHQHTSHNHGHSHSQNQQVKSKCHSTKYLGQSCKFHGQCSHVTENSLCLNGLCACTESNYVPSEDRRKCLEIAKFGLNSSCDEDTQCTKSDLGPLSSCNEDRNKCECSQEFPTVYHQGKCYLRRQLGATCESPFECKEDSESLAECYEGRCRCGKMAIVSEENQCVARIEEKVITRASSSSSSASSSSSDSITSSLASTLRFHSNMSLVWILKIILLLFSRCDICFYTTS